MGPVFSQVKPISGAFISGVFSPTRHHARTPWTHVHNDIEFVINLLGIVGTLAPLHDDDNDFVNTGLHDHTTATLLAATTTGHLFGARINRRFQT